jgi:hypothetical protein
MAARKQYTGRLAFDPETGFHLSEDGKPVVTLDEGATWVYADKADASHIDRYHQGFATFDTTANHLLELQLEHGREKAEQLMREQQPHHFEVADDDAHANGIRFDPDHVAATVTSHTEAYR